MIIKTGPFFLLILLLCSYNIFAQAPIIKYTTPQTYIINKKIIPLAPNNNGIQVPTTIYGTVNTLAGGTNVFNSPVGLAKNAAGTLYTIDVTNSIIRSVSLGGAVSFVAGSGNQGSSDGAGAAADFDSPQNLAADAAGNIYVTDVGNNLIRKVAPDGTVTALTGSNLGYIDGPLAVARFDRAVGIAIDKAGNIFVTDVANNAIRKINTTLGLITTFAGLTFGPRNLAIDDNDNLYFSSTTQVFKITPAGVISTIAGNGNTGATDGAALAAGFNNISGMAVDHSGNIYVADAGNYLIRKISTAGVVSTIAGSGTSGYIDDIGIAASFSVLNQATISTDGNLYIADGLNRAIRKITLTGYTIDKPLPPGMLFDGTTGVITGTPNTIWPPTDYTITAYNKDGGYSTILNLQVVNAPSTLPSVITFPPMVTKNLTSPDFSADVTSTNNVTPVIYTSSNTAVATISTAGIIHITGIGTTTITASQNGNANYDAATPQSQVLTVTAIPVVVNIYNTFSPNGDGINDLWDIPDLTGYPQCMVNIYNRYGTMIYQSKGYTKAWDGKYKGAKVPAGVYYYLISLGGGNAPLSGNVTIIR